MFKKITRRALEKRHFWRYASFDELVELYVSNMLRAVAANVFSIFVPIYLLKSGYSLTMVAWYFCFYFVVRFFGDIACGFIVAKIGPKHTWILSHLCNIINLVCLLGVTTMPWLFWVSSLFNALGTSFQFIPLHVDFSKIKHTEHNGKEQGFFLLLDRLGGAAGPLLGGYIAATYGASYTILASIVFYFGSLIPLLSTPEQVKTRQRIKFKGFPFKHVWRDILVHSVQGIDTTVTYGMWPLFMTLVIFSGTAYKEIGFASTLSILVAIFSTFILARFIDGNHPLRFFRLAVIANGLVYVGRLFSTSMYGVLGVNVANEVAVSGSLMANNKGMYAAADNLPGYRIAYFTILEAVSECVKGGMWLALGLLSIAFSDVSALKICFVLAGVLVLGMMLENYSALRPRISRRLLQ